MVKRRKYECRGNKNVKSIICKSKRSSSGARVSSKMYETFVSTYKEANPNTEITELDLFALDLPYYGNIAISGGYKRSQGMELTAEEEKAVATVDQYLNQF